MRIAKLPCVLSILLSLSPIQRNIVVLAAADQSAITAVTTTTIIARGILQSGNRCIVSETIAGDAKDGNDDCRHRVFGESGECNQLCLRPVSAQSDFYLRTLRHRRFDRQEKDGCDNNKGNSKNNYTDTFFCWESVRDTESTPPTPEHDTAVTVAVTNFHFPSSVVRLDRKQANDNAIEPRSSLATKINLLFATRKVQNNEIRLPRSIAEIFQQETTTTTTTTTAARNEEDSGTTTPGEEEEEEESAAAEVLPGNTHQKSLAADQGVVDLTGRWRPSETISAQDLADYDEFLKACCSDTISYWTRKLVVSSSIVSRQELLVKQLDQGRIVEFVDIHPLASNVWNRTIVLTSSNGSSEGDSQSDRSHRPNPNRLNGPRGDPVLIEAYWQKNGTVFTSFLRNDNNDGDSNANKALVQTRRYLRSEEEGNDAETNRVMVVETIYYPTYNIETPDEQGDNAAATRMVWNWEEVIE